MTLEQALNDRSGDETETKPAEQPKPRKTRGPYNTKKKQAAAARKTPEQIGEAAFMRLSNARQRIFPAPIWQFWKWRKQLQVASGYMLLAMEDLKPLALRAAAKDGAE